MVEWKKIDDVILSLKTGLNPRANFVLNTPESKIPYITGKDIFENRINVTDKTDMIDDKALSLINKRACLEDNLLLFASTGTGTVGRMAIVDKYNYDWGMSETLYASKTKDYITPYFLMYCLYSNNIKSQFEPKISKGSVPHLKVVDLLKVQIPIPSLQEQERIVGILDTFTSSIDNLKQQIAQRRKQYEYYRDQLLDLEGKERVAIVPLREVVKSYCTGATPNKGHLEYYESGTIPWLRTQDVKFNEIYEIDSFVTEEAVAKTGVKWIPSNCVIVAISGATAGRCAINKIPTTTNQHCLNLEINPKKALYKYIYYCVYNAYSDMVSRKQGARGDLNSSIILGITIPVPSLSEQQRIVDILDKFEASIQNLEAQLSQREKQYEYYRNKLLTFE